MLECGFKVGDDDGRYLYGVDNYNCLFWCYLNVVVKRFSYVKVLVNIYIG